MTFTNERSPNPNQKGGAIEGGLVSREFLESSDSVLDQSRGIDPKGAQQWYTPPEAARLIANVLDRNSVVFDPTAGDGSLLKDFEPDNRFGVEIDPDQIINAKNAEQPYHFIEGDIQQVFHLFHRALEFPNIVANPPFGLRWSEPSLHEGEVNSARLTMMMIRASLADDGQFVFIGGQGTFDKEIANKPEAAGIYAIIDCPDLFDGTRTPAVICFGVGKSYEIAEPVRREINRENLDLLAEWVRESRSTATGGRHFRAYFWEGDEFKRGWKSVRAEYKRRKAKKDEEAENREFDVSWFGGDRLQVNFSPYTTLVLNRADKGYTATRLNGSSVNYFLQNERDWHLLSNLEKDGLITMEPTVRPRIEEALAHRSRDLCPLYPLKPQQRLGYLEDIDRITCTKSDPERGFIQGVAYDLDTQSTIIEKIEYKCEQIKSGKRAGEWEDRVYTIHKKALKITIGHWSLTDTEDDGADIQYLVDHFEIPDPGDVKSRYPEEYAAKREVVERVAARIEEQSAIYAAENPIFPAVTLEEYQIDNLTRLLMKEDGLLAWEQGLGKTLGGILFAECQIEQGCQEAVMVICPGDLIDQWGRELERFTGKKFELVRSHGKAREIHQHLRKGKGTGWYISYPEALSVVGVKGKQQKLPELVVEEKTVTELVKGTDRYGYYVFNENNEQEPITHSEFTKIYNDPEDHRRCGHGYIRARWQEVTKKITSKDVCPNCKSSKRDGWNGESCEAELPNGDKCNYVHFAVKIKPIGSFLSVAFRNGIIINDESTMIQGDNSIRSKVIRGMRCRRKLGMTGTPIKNYIPQAFWPLWWCLGNNSPRFGYDYDNGKKKFEENFAVASSFRVQGDNTVRGQKFLPEVTNLSRLWRMLSSTVIRTKKEDTGKWFPPKHYIPIEVPMGMEQNRQVNKWLKMFPRFFEELYPDAPVVRSGMHEHMAPMLGLNVKLERAEILPEGDPHKDWIPSEAADPTGKFSDIEPSNWTPAVFKALELSMALVKNGHKVLLGSSWVQSGPFLAEQLQEKGVRAMHIVDSSGQTLVAKKRAKTIFNFQTEDEIDVLCTGVKAIQHGHNIDSATAIVFLGLDWSWDTFDQFVNRIHRFTSTKPIQIYVILMGEGMTKKKWELLNQKGQTASLALDGHIAKREDVEIDKNSVIRELMEKGVPTTGDEVEEELVRKAWVDFPMLENYEPEPHVLPELNHEKAFDPVDQLYKAFAYLRTFATGYGEFPEVEEPTEAEMFEMFGEPVSLEELAAVDERLEEEAVVLAFDPVDRLHKYGSFMRSLQPVEETTEEVANVTSEVDPVLAALQEMKEQMAQLQQENAEMRSKLAEVEANAQMSLDLEAA